MTKAEARQIIREVVRGERPWTDLRPLGMAARPAEGRGGFSPTFPGDTWIDVFDIARGLRASLGDPRRLREWAFVVEALPGEFAVEAHPASETVMDAVWSASFGEPLTEDQLRLIETLAHEDGQPS
jgi:hypothetical protein